MEWYFVLEYVSPWSDTFKNIAMINRAGKQAQKKLILERIYQMGLLRTYISSTLCNDCHNIKIPQTTCSRPNLYGGPNHTHDMCVMCDYPRKCNYCKEYHCDYHSTTCDICGLFVGIDNCTLEHISFGGACLYTCKCCAIIDFGKID